MEELTTAAVVARISRSSDMAAAACHCWHIAGTSHFRWIAAASAVLLAELTLTCTDCSGLSQLSPVAGLGRDC
jgi:hypothetical protein